MFAAVELTKKFPVEIEGIEKQLWKDITAPYKSYAGGHLYRYDPAKGDVERYTNDSPAQLEDLGIPVPNNTIYAMALSPDKRKIYGLTYPDAHFFVFDIETKTTKDLGEIPDAQGVTAARSATGAACRGPCTAIRKTGDVYMSGDNGFSSATACHRQARADLHAPSGRLLEGLSSYDYPVVEAFETGAGGNVYAGYQRRLPRPPGLPAATMSW